MTTSTPKSSRPAAVSKRCPWCLAYLPLEATVCHACKKKVGQVNRRGMAKKPVDIKAYLMAAAAVAGFGYYIWWAFLKS